MEIKYHEILIKMCGANVCDIKYHEILFKLCDYEGIACRHLENRRKQRNEPFTSNGSMKVVSVDGHDKLCGYQNSALSLGAYGFIDTFSRKILSLKVTISNSDSRVIGKQYFDLLYELKMCLCFRDVTKGHKQGKWHLFIVT